MHRRSFLKNAGLTMAALALADQQLFARLLADPAYKLRMLRNNVGIFSEKGGTIAYLLSKKGLVVVDAQFPDTAKHLIEELKKQSDKAFRLLINTHHHGDHTSGNIAFKGLVKNVVAHANSFANQQRVAKDKKTEDKQLYPDITFNDTWKQKVGKEHIKAHHFGAAHTNGDAFIHFEHANIVHTGDLVFNRRYPFVDRNGGASVKSWITVLEKAIGTFNKDTLFIFGHAFDPEKVTGNLDDLKAMQTFLSRTIDFTDTQIKAGKTKEEILKTTAIPGDTEWKGDGIERILTATYEELKAG
jgi:cyclase